MSAGNPDQKVYVYAVFSSLKTVTPQTVTWNSLESSHEGAHILLVCPGTCLIHSGNLGVARGPLQEKDPCNFNTEIFVSKVGQLMCNSWSTSSQPDFVHTLGRRRTARNRQGKFLYTELLKRWPTLGQLFANSPPHGKLQGSSLQ